MKKTLLLFVLITLTLSSCSQKPEATPHISEQKYETICDQILFVGDADSFKVMNAVNQQWNTEHGTSYELIPSAISKKRLQQGKEFGFYINGVWVPYSNTILNKGLAAISPNSRIPAAKLFNEVFCLSQGNKVTSVYTELTCNDQVVCTDGNLICDSTVSVNKSKSENNFSFLDIPWWWVLPLLFLLLLLLMFLMTRRNKSNATSVTESKQDDCCSEIRNDIKNLSEQNSKNHNQVMEVIKQIPENKHPLVDIIKAANEGGGDNQGYSHLEFADEKNKLFAAYTNNKSDKSFSREEMIETTVINILGDNKMSKEVIKEFLENKNYQHYESQDIINIVIKLKEEDDTKE